MQVFCDSQDDIMACAVSLKFLLACALVHKELGNASPPSEINSRHQESADVWCRLKDRSRDEFWEPHVILHWALLSQHDRRFGAASAKRGNNAHHRVP